MKKKRRNNAPPTGPIIDLDSDGSVIIPGVTGQSPTNSTANSSPHPADTSPLNDVTSHETAVAASSTVTMSENATVGEDNEVTTVCLLPSIVLLLNGGILATNGWCSASRYGPNAQVSCGAYFTGRHDAS